MDPKSYPCTSLIGELSPLSDISIVPIERGLFSEEDMKIMTTSGIDSVDVRSSLLPSSKQSKAIQNSPRDEVTKDSSSVTRLMRNIPARLKSPSKRRGKKHGKRRAVNFSKRGDVVSKTML